MSAVEWTKARPVSPPLRLSASVLAEILDGGQAFRWIPASEGGWRGIFSTHLVWLHIEEERVCYAYPKGGKDPGAALARYLARSTDFDDVMDSLPWRSDHALRSAIEALPGLRILRQPFGETLLAFLASSNKQIVQIRQILEALAIAFGEPLAPGRHALPTWERIAGLSEASLRLCKLGYRARYVHETAQILAEESDWLAVTESLPYTEAKARLLRLPGVGEKVADCVLLFGAGRLEAFPVDTWVQRAMERRYNLTGWRLAQVAHFGRVHFGPYAGFAQQLLFAAERRRAQLSDSVLSKKSAM